jgi:lipid A 3-O-deacylase
MHNAGRIPNCSSNINVACCAEFSVIYRDMGLLGRSLTLYFCLLALTEAPAAQPDLQSATAGETGESANTNSLFRLESIGVRGGFPANESGKDFNQAELFMDWQLPWWWNLGAQWRLQTRLDLSLGWLGSSTDNAFIGTLGPSLILEKKDSALSLEGGISPTVLSKDDLGAKNFGTKFQFTTHIGLNWDIASRVRLSYRFQHMSNAHLGEHNPGLNLHMLGISYLF